MTTSRRNNKTRSSPRLPEGVADTPLETMPKIELNGKKPVEKDWPNKGQLNVDFKNVGYKPCGYVVFDTDGPEGREAFARLLNELELPTRITTFATATPNNGLHIFYLDPEIGFRNSVNVCGLQRVDIRVAPGGFVRDYPSPGYRIVNRRPSEPMPDKLVEYFRDKFAERDAKLEARKTAAGGTQKHSLSGLLYTIHNARQGERNATLFWAASRVAEMPARRHGSALRQLEHAAADIGLHHTEIDKTIASAMGGAR